MRRLRDVMGNLLLLLVCLGARKEVSFSTTIERTLSSTWISYLHECHCLDGTFGCAKQKIIIEKQDCFAGIG